MAFLYSYWTLGSLASQLIATLMFLVSFSTRAWMVSFDALLNYHTEVGLWKSCIYSRTIEKTCQSMMDSQGKFRATQAFMCLAFITFIVSWLMQFVSMRENSTKRRTFLIVCLICLFCNAFELMVAAACTADIVQSSLGYSFYLAVFSCLFLVLAAILRWPDISYEAGDENKDGKDGTAPFSKISQQPSNATLASHI